MAPLRGCGSVASTVTPAGELFVFYYDYNTLNLTLAKTNYTANQTTFQTYPVKDPGGSWIRGSNNVPLAPLAACYWNKVVMLFYVDQYMTLQDVWTKDGISWRQGSLGNRHIKIWLRSGLTAVGGPHCKVIFSEDGGVLMEARYDKNQWKLPVDLKALEALEALGGGAKPPRPVAYNGLRSLRQQAEPAVMRQRPACMVDI
ncbi:hypothetical protein DL766_000356 [Monosporascus sp. MC13-8B]|nr:hypothetical protein DL766_000356 [Monosporascus sp. MC13-8B]